MYDTWTHSQYERHSFGGGLGAPYVISTVETDPPMGGELLKFEITQESLGKWH